MKVGDSFSLVPPQATQRAIGTATTSFATLLASGRSVSAIRSERAFGFSETGLLGATRSSDISSPASTGSKTIEANQLSRLQPTQTQSQTYESNKIVSANRTAILGIADAEQLITDRAFSLRDARERNALTTDNVQRARTDSRSNYSKVQRDSLSIINADRRLPAEKWRRRLSLSGPDDALTISIHEFSDEKHQDAELFYVFSSIAIEFGMTLRAIQLQSNGFNLKLESGRV